MTTITDLFKLKGLTAERISGLKNIHFSMKYVSSLLLILIFSFTVQAQKQKVIFDCDLGGDIDDAFAVALLLCSQENIEILGFCMDHGNTPGRARVATKMLHETGFEDIPVYVGRHTVTRVGIDTELEGESIQFLWAEGFDNMAPQKAPAADFIIEQLTMYPGEIILFTVGPVDNIADVLDKDPEVLKKAKKVISMFGSIEIGYSGGAPSAEWNVAGSIEAGKKLMNSGANILLAPLDITDHVILTDNYLNAIAMRDTPLTNALGSLYALWYRSADWATQAKMFDGVAVGMLLWPELFETKRVFVDVDDAGFTKVDDNKSPNCTIGVKIDADAFIQKMSRRLVEQNFHK